MPEQSEDPAGRWWNGWWDQDFSWAGLARKPIGMHGGLHGERTLQEYWRRDPATGAMRDDAEMEAAGELIRAPDGALWHVVHVPLHWRSGGAAKVAWDERRVEAFAWVVDGRVAAAAETSIDISCDATGPDGRTQLAGAVLLVGPRPPAEEETELHLHCDWAWLPGWSNGGVRLGAGFRCQNGIFSGDARFELVKFSGGASFYGATFSGDASFGGATLSGDAEFYNSTFSGDANFDGATFSGHASFLNATFSGYASFLRATFSGHASFFSATFLGHADFIWATLSGGASFVDATFSKNAGFGGATLSGDANFDGSTFSGHANFDGSTFSGDASFDGAAFSGEADFRGATLSADARFVQAEFAKAVSFDDGRFGTDAGEGNARGAVSFHRSNFAGPVSLRGRAFHGRVDFTAATFVRQAWFTEIRWPKAAADWHGAFDQAVFRDVASFRDSGFGHFAAFDGAGFEGALQLDDTAEATANETFAAELAAATALDGAAPKTGGWPSARLAARLSGSRGAASKDGEPGLKQLERGCRVLKQAMESASHKTREQILHAFELIARRSQRDTPWWEKAVSHLYAATSDYGRSIARPLLVLLASIPAFALAYWVMLGPQADRDGATLFRECLAFSLERLLPISTGEPTPGSVRALLFGRGQTTAELAARVLGAVQPLFSLVMAFLSGLAIRRRFQIT